MSARRRELRARRSRDRWLDFRAPRRGKLHHFEKLLAGMSAQDLSLVANLEQMTANVRMYDAASRKRLFVGEYLPWPVKLMMVKYHRKHVFENRHPPTRATFLKVVCNLEHKFKWRAATPRVVGGGGAWAKHKMHVIKPYKGFTEPARRGFLGKLRSRLLEVYSRVRKQNSYGNINAAARRALRWLSDENITLALFDKESGFCLN